MGHFGGQEQKISKDKIMNVNLLSLERSARDRVSIPRECSNNGECDSKKARKKRKKERKKARLSASRRGSALSFIHVIKVSLSESLTEEMSTLIDFQQIKFRSAFSGF